MEEGRKAHLMKIVFLCVFTGLERSLQICKEIYFEARLRMQLFLLDVKFEACLDKIINVQEKLNLLKKISEFKQVTYPPVE